jgi:hypothetical protein
MIDPASPARPRVSRETRMLIATIVISIGALWVLSRIRFPERDAAPTPVPPILTQLVRPPSFADLAAAVADIQAQVAPFLVAVPATQGSGADLRAAVQALRIGGDLAVALTAGARSGAGDIVGRDHATGLTVIKAPHAAVSAPSTWTPRQLQYPRYLFAADGALDGPALRPLFVDGLHPADTPLWPAMVWTVQAQVDARPGTFLFTADGSFAGLVVETRGRAAIVPADTVLREAERVRQAGYRSAGRLGLEVRELTPAIVSVIGEASGVLVTWVDSSAAAAGKLEVGDLIESIGGAPVPTIEHWVARTAPLASGDTAALRVRRHHDTIDITVMAGGVETASAAVLGLTMRANRGVGAEIVGVSRGSAGERAGLKAGDVINLMGTVKAPSPAQVTRVFATTPDGGSILAAFTRGDHHDVVALVKR